MKSIQNEALRIGLTEIDQQHEELFETIDKLNSEVKNQEDLWEILISIENYILNHFSSEEKQMRNLNYEDYKSHKMLHDKFAEEFKEISDEITDYHAGMKVLPSLKAFIELWAENHYKKADIKLINFLRKNL